MPTVPDLKVYNQRILKARYGIEELGPHEIEEAEYSMRMMGQDMDTLQESLARRKIVSLDLSPLVTQLGLGGYRDGVHMWQEDQQPLMKAIIEFSLSAYPAPRPDTVTKLISPELRWSKNQRRRRQKARREARKQNFGVVAPFDVMPALLKPSEKLPASMLFGCQ